MNGSENLFHHLALRVQAEEMNRQPVSVIAVRVAMSAEEPDAHRTTEKLHPPVCEVSPLRLCTVAGPEFGRSRYRLQLDVILDEDDRFARCQPPRARLETVTGAFCCSSSHAVSVSPAPERPPGAAS